MRLTTKVHTILNKHIQEGDCALDATAGNGHDTLKLTQLVGHSGLCIAIDCQQQALENTHALLKANDCLHQSQLLLGDHGSLLQQLAYSFKAVVFNLGYLPGSDKKTITEVHSTIKALNAIRKLLDEKGILTVTAYREHAGGLAESKAVENWMLEQKKAKHWRVHSIEADRDHDRDRVSVPTDPRKERLSPILWVASPSLSLESLLKLD